MRGERLDEATLRWSGFAGDRQYAFYRTADTTRFPWLTGREVPGLVTYAADYDDPSDPRRSALRVTGPDGRSVDVFDRVLRVALSDLAGTEVRAIQVGRGTFDSMPVSVVSTATQAAVAAAHDGAVDLRRFRPNIVVEPVDGARESDWIGGTLIFGDGPDAARVRVNGPIERCAMVNLDPDTAAKDPSVLRTVAQAFANEIGVYCAPDAMGPIRVGDRVRLLTVF